MKFNLTFGLIFSVSSIVFSQIGIGVSNPKEMLEVDNGKVYVKEKFYIDIQNIESYKGGVDEFRITATEPKEGKFMEFAGNQEIMPIIIQPYRVKGINKDNLKLLNLNIPSSKYVISLSNFQAVPIDNNSGIYRISTKGSGSRRTYVYDNFEIKTINQNGSWHVKIGADEADPREGSYEYHFDIILFPKRFFRDLGEVPYNLRGANTGSANTAPSGI